MNSRKVLIAIGRGLSKLYARTWSGRRTALTARVRRVLLVGDFVGTNIGRYLYNFFVYLASRPIAGLREVHSQGGRNRMTITDLIIFLVIGAIAGWLAGQIMRGGGFGLIGNIVVGIIGSLIGGWLFGLFGIAAGGLIGSIIAAVVGAIILIAIVRLIKRA